MGMTATCGRGGGGGRGRGQDGGIERGSDGVMELWSDGVMEVWSRIWNWGCLSEEPGVGGGLDCGDGDGEHAGASHSYDTFRSGAGVSRAPRFGRWPAVYECMRSEETTAGITMNDSLSRSGDPDRMEMEMAILV